MSSSITTRLIILLSLCAALIMGTSMLIDYRLSRNEILERLQVESQDTIRAAVIDLENWLDSVEGSTLFLARILEQRDYSHGGIEQMLKDILENNQDIFGSTIALNPELSGTENGFAPYYFRKDGILTYVDLAGDRLNYQQQPWYTETVAAGKPVWVEPYFDLGGAETLMTTFAVPVYRTDEAGNRFLYAVVTADVTLAELDGYLSRLQLGDSGFGILLSRSGVILSGNEPANVMRHYSEVKSYARDLEAWSEMFQLARTGQSLTRQLECPRITGRCVIRLGTLNSTGWLVGVIYSEQELLEPLRAYQLKTALIGLITLVVMTLTVFLVISRITRPLTALAHASDAIAKGTLDRPLPRARGQDELAKLVRSFGAMQRDLKTYIGDLETATASRSRLEGELMAAREIQMSMLPQGGEALEIAEQYELWAKVRPAKSVGGDLYSYYQSDGRLFLALGDVSDKGVPAALFMARAISLIQQLMASGTEPGPAMARLNDALESGNDNCMFVTLFLAVLDLESAQLHFSSAGHTPPSLLRNGAVHILSQADGPALGLAPGLTFPDNTVQLEPGDRLAIYTDGIDEAFNEKAQMFGADRFNQWLCNSAGTPLAIAGASAFKAVDDYAGSMPQSDDISLMLLHLMPESDNAEVNTATGQFVTGDKLTGRILDWLPDEMAKLDVPPDLHMELTLITEEIVSNIEKYGELPPGSQVEFSIQVAAATVCLEARDAGVAFNPLEQAQRSKLGADIESAEIGGLGVHLITQFTDEQHYNRVDERNVLRVVKCIPFDTA